MDGPLFLDFPNSFIFKYLVKKKKLEVGETSPELNSRDIWSFEVQMKISLIPPNSNELGREPHPKKYCNKILSNFTWYRDLMLDVSIPRTMFILVRNLGNPCAARLRNRYESRMMFEISRYPRKFTKVSKFTHLNSVRSC